MSHHHERHEIKTSKNEGYRGSGCFRTSAPRASNAVTQISDTEIFTGHSAAYGARLIWV